MNLQVMYLIVILQFKFMNFHHYDQTPLFYTLPFYDMLAFGQQLAYYASSFYSHPFSLYQEKAPQNQVQNQINSIHSEENQEQAVELECPEVDVEEQKGAKKRRYRKRRYDLQKKFICVKEGCCKHYSSKVAWNQHNRKCHQIFIYKPKNQSPQL